MFFKSQAHWQQEIAPCAQTLFGDNLICLFHQNWRVSVFLHSNNPKDLPDFAPFLKILSKAKASLAYIFSPEMVFSAADTFPLEFLELSHRHTVLAGEFPLTGFTPDLASLRHQCERELRGYLIHLRREAAIHSQSSKDMQSMIAATLPQFDTVFLGIFWLTQAGRFPQGRSQCLETIDQTWQLGNLFSRLVNPPKDVKELRWLVGDYILGIETILKSIDRMEVPS